MAQAKTAARAAQEAPAGTMTAPAAGSADAVDRTLDRLEQEIFLSTRVVDQRSFEELAGTLQRIIRESVAQGRSLLSASDQVRGVSDNLRSLIRDLQLRTEQAAKAAPQLEAKLSRAQALVSRVTNESALAKAREMRDAVLHELEAQREALVREAVAKVIAESREQIEAQVRKVIGEAVAQSPALGAFAKDARALPQAPTATVIDEPRTRELIEQLQRIVREGEAASERAEARLAGVQSATDAALHRAEQGEKSLEEALLRAQVRFKGAVEEHERRTENVATEIAEQLLALRADAQSQVAKAKTLIDASREGAAVALQQMLESSRAQLVEQAASQVLEGAKSAAQALVERSRGELERVADTAIRRVESVADAAQASIRAASTQALDDVGARLTQLREQRAALEHALEASTAKARAELERASSLALTALHEAQTARATVRPDAPDERDIETFFSMGARQGDALAELHQAIDAAQQAIESTHAAAEELRALRDDADSAREALGEQVAAAGEAMGLMDERVTQATRAEAALRERADEVQRVQQAAPAPAPAAPAGMVAVDQVGAIVAQLIRAGVVQAPAPARPALSTTPSASKSFGSPASPTSAGQTAPASPSTRASASSPVSRPLGVKPPPSLTPPPTAAPSPLRSPRPAGPGAGGPGLGDKKPRA